MAPGDSGLPRGRLRRRARRHCPAASVFDDECYLNWWDETGSHYGYMRGTSFASPEVAGIAALIWAVRPGADELAGGGHHQAVGNAQLGGVDPADGLRAARRRRRSRARREPLGRRMGRARRAPDRCRRGRPVLDRGNLGTELAHGAGPAVTRAGGLEPLDQTITFPRLANRKVGDPAFSIAATASSGLPVSFMAIGKCTVHGTKVRLKGAGTCVIIASQPGDDRYKSAELVSRSFRIAKADPRPPHLSSVVPQSRGRVAAAPRLAEERILDNRADMNEDPRFRAGGLRVRAYTTRDPGGQDMRGNGWARGRGAARALHVSTTLIALVIAAVLVVGAGATADRGNFKPGKESWRSIATNLRTAHPGLKADFKLTKSRAFALDRGRLAQLLAKAPAQTKSVRSQKTIVVSLPDPSGKFQRFALHRSNVMAPGLAAKHPDISTYSGIGIDDAAATIHADLSHTRLPRVGALVERDVVHRSVLPPRTRASTRATTDATSPDSSRAVRRARRQRGRALRRQGLLPRGRRRDALGQRLRERRGRHDHDLRPGGELRLADDERDTRTRPAPSTRASSRIPTATSRCTPSRRATAATTRRRRATRSSATTTRRSIRRPATSCAPTGSR